ncbi:putative RNA-binding motif protein [Helianthus annuus]|nr:putative RNA-binding motif protein [Helianthus annuus]
MANVADVDALDFEPDDDDLMDEDAAVDVDATSPRVSAHIPKLKSAITGGSVTAAAVKKTKGRGFREETDAERNNRMSGRFDSLDSDGGPGPERCWFATILKSPKHLSHNMPTHLNRGMPQPSFLFIAYIHYVCIYMLITFRLSVFVIAVCT